MFNEVEELINRIDSSKQICECCREWRNKKDFAVPTLVLNSSCEWHNFCIYCVVKIKYIQEHKHYIQDQIENLNYHYQHYLDIEKNDLSISYYRKLISYHYSFKNYIEQQKLLTALKIQQEMYSSPKPLVLHEFY